MASDVRGTWAEFSTSPSAIGRCRSRPGAALMSRWNAATLSPRMIRYNFAPKLDWPDEQPNR